MKKVFFLLGIIILFSSCRNYKFIHKDELTREKETVHHYHDSIHVIERIESVPVVIPPDSSFFQFTLQNLIDKKEINHSQGRIHTRIIKDDSGLISVYNTIDSLIEMVEVQSKETFRLQRQLKETTDQLVHVINTSEEKNTGGFLKDIRQTIMWIIGLLIVFAAIYIYFKYFRIS